MARCAELTNDGRPCRRHAIKSTLVARWVAAGLVTTAQAAALVPPLRKHLRCFDHALRMLGPEVTRKVRTPVTWKLFDLRTVPKLQCNAIASSGVRCRAKAMPNRTIERLRADGHPAKYGQCYQHAIKLTSDRTTLLRNKDEPHWKRMSFASARQCEAVCTAKHDSRRKHRRGERCKKPALKGKRVCAFHGGLTPSYEDKPRTRHGKTKQLWQANGRKSRQLALEYQKRREAGEPLGISHKPAPEAKPEFPLWEQFKGRRRD